MPSRIHFFVLAIISAVSFGVSAVCAQETPDLSAEYFFYHCAGCHTIGKGAGTGPDLINVRTWKHEDLRSAVKNMEKKVGPISEEDIQKMIAFLQDISAPSRLSQQKEKIEASLRSELPQPSRETGRSLFIGRKSLAGGGPACISCHRFGRAGGNLGPDLTLIKDKVSGVALQSAIENSAYKVMRPIYEKRKIAKEEALHLSEYLSHPEQSEEGFVPEISAVVAAAGAGFVAFFFLMWNLNRIRKGSTRKNLIQKSIKG